MEVVRQIAIFRDDVNSNITNTTFEAWKNTVNCKSLKYKANTLTVSQRNSPIDIHVYYTVHFLDAVSQ